MSLHRKLARRLPRRVRRWFVRTVDRLAWRKREPGTHHGGVSR